MTLNFYVQELSRLHHGRAARTTFVWALVLLMLASCGARDDSHVAVTGQIEATTVRPGSRVGGRVIEVPVEEGDRVAAGDVLVRLEATDAEAGVDAAKAALDQAKAALERLETGARSEEIRQARAMVDQANAMYRMAVEGTRQQDIERARAALESAQAVEKEAATAYERARELVEKDVAPQQRLDQAEAARETASSQVRAAQEELNKLLEGTRQEDIDAAKAALEQAQANLDLLLAGARVEDIAAARAVVQAAKADLARAEKTLAEMTVTAPMAGLVQTLDVEPGDLVGPGALATLVDPEDLELAVYVSAAMLGHLQVGQEVTVTTDSHGDRRFTGRISRIGVSGEFTPRNLQTQEERVQQVFPVDLELTSHEGLLRPGMSATAHFPVPDAVAAE